MRAPTTRRIFFVLKSDTLVESPFVQCYGSTSTGVRLLALDLRRATTKCGSRSSTNSTKQKEYKGTVLHLELHMHVNYACESLRTRSEAERSRRITTILSLDVSNSQTHFTQLCLVSGDSATYQTTSTPHSIRSLHTDSAFYLGIESCRLPPHLHPCLGTGMDFWGSLYRVEIY